MYDVSGAGSDRNCVVLNDIHIDIMDYIVPASCDDTEFRQMWAEFEWENKVAVNTNISNLSEFLQHVIKITNMKCLTPEKVRFHLLYPRKRSWGRYIGIALSVCPEYINLGYNFWYKKERGFHITHVYSLWGHLSIHTKFFDLVTLTLTFDILLKKLNLRHSFWIFLVARPFCQ